MTDKPRLIEVAFPLKQASLASVHEKNMRHGHISTIHIWPARRPLAACRAGLLATLLPDPGEPLKRQQLLDKIGGKVVKKQVEETDDDGNKVVEEKDVVEGGVLAWGQENSPVMEELREAIKKFYGGNVPKVLDPFSGGGAIPLEAMRLGCNVTAADLNPVAWMILKCTLDYPRQFVGKKWPLPGFVREWPDFIHDFLAGKIKKRKGDKKAHFSDPQQLAFLELPEADLSWHIRAWGRWILERSKADLASRYPRVNSEPTVAYLWSRTVRDKVTAGRVPLLKTFWLCKKKGRRAAIIPIPKEDKSGVTFCLIQDAEISKPQTVIEAHPILKEWEISADAFVEFLNKGTMNRAGVWSPVSGRPGIIALTMDDLRRQGQQGLLGTQMTAVVVEAIQSGGKKTYKRYRLPSHEELAGADVSQEDLEQAFVDIPHGIPTEPLPQGGGSGAGRAFSIPKYGFKLWREIFTPRQLLALGTIVKHTREAIRQISREDEKKGVAVGCCLALAVDRIADYSSNLCSWHIPGQKLGHTFARYALQMVWDFCEVAPLSETSGNYLGGVEWVAQAVAHAGKATEAADGAKVMQASAIASQLSGLSIVVTDPPYYDAIPYSDLMDFFYIWLKRSLAELSPSIDPVFKNVLSPKWSREESDGELVDDESRFGGDKEASKRAYEDGMAKAFERCCSALDDAGRLVVVFANKSVDAWETLVGALIRGGAVVTASWPIQTEMQTRMRGLSSAALSTSVWIVCRKRPKTAVAGWEERVLDRMKQILFDPREELGGRNILQYYFDLGIRGPDFMWAALGPALQAYSEHPFVKKTAGGVMIVPEFLKEVRKLVLQFSLGELPGFREVSQETGGRGESLEIDPVTQYYLLHRAYFGLEPAPAGACILYANACGKNESELKVVWNILEQGGKSKRGRPRNDDEEAVEEEGESDSKGNEYRLLGWDERASRDGLGDGRAGQAAPLVDRLHRLMALFQQNRTSEVQQLFDGWGLANDRAFRPLLQAVRELALRDKQDTERRLVEALATQLKMNRKTVVVNNELKEMPLFASIQDGGRDPVTY